MKKTAEVKWQKLYDSFNAPLCAFDCGTLCAPGNGGIPACCTNEDCPPIIYTDELRWLRSRTNLWRKRRACTAEDKRDDAEIEDHVKYAQCKGVANCDRRYRTLTCRFFPLEPYVDEKGVFVGLTYVYECEHVCPIVANDNIEINPEYVRQAIAVWREIFRAYPLEYETYRDESRKLRRRFRRRNRPVALFTETESSRSLLGTTGRGTACRAA